MTDFFKFNKTNLGCAIQSINFKLVSAKFVDGNRILECEGSTSYLGVT